MSASPQREIAFISGPIDTGPNETYFHEYYLPRIQQAIARGDEFVIGPIPSGVDADALRYLLAYPVSPSRITIFVNAAEDGMWGAGFRALGVNVQRVECQTTRERDTALTNASTYDILRVRTRPEAQAFYGELLRDGYVTNTERNWKRRRGIAEEVVADANHINRSMGFAPVMHHPQKTVQGLLRQWIDQVLERHR